MVAQNDKSCTENPQTGQQICGRNVTVGTNLMGQHDLDEMFINTRGTDGRH